MKTLRIRLVKFLKQRIQKREWIETDFPLVDKMRVSIVTSVQRKGIVKSVRNKENDTLRPVIVVTRCVSNSQWKNTET